MKAGVKDMRSARNNEAKVHVDGKGAVLRYLDYETDREYVFELSYGDLKAMVKAVEKKRETLET